VIAEPEVDCIGLLFERLAREGDGRRDVREERLVFGAEIVVL
jgi:hypothetical protein